MCPWCGCGRPGCGFDVLFARPRHSASRGAWAVAARLPRRRRGGNCGSRPEGTRARRGIDGVEGGVVTLGQIPSASAIERAAFDVERARADFEILSRRVYGKP